MELENRVHREKERYFRNVDPIGNYQQVIGAWVNDDDYAFIEVSDIVFDREQAIALGKERGEEAIWDFKNNCEIKLTSGNATPYEYSSYKEFEWYRDLTTWDAVTFKAWP